MALTIHRVAGVDRARDPRAYAGVSLIVLLALSQVLLGILWTLPFMILAGGYLLLVAAYTLAMYSTWVRIRFEDSDGAVQTVHFAQAPRWWRPFETWRGGRLWQELRDHVKAAPGPLRMEPYSPARPS